MAGVTTYLPILTLNVNGLNSPNKRFFNPDLANRIKREDPTIGCLQETHFIDTDKH
jgi:exonuclease III